MHSIAAACFAIKCPGVALQSIAPACFAINCLGFSLQFTVSSPCRKIGLLQAAPAATSLRLIFREDRSSSSSSSSDECVPEFQGLKREVWLVLGSANKLDSEATVFVHKMSDVVHFRTEKLISTLKCSRKISENFRRVYRPFDESGFRYRTLCTHCFGK